MIGCVVYPASELIAPGVVRHIEGDRFPVGELDGSTSERVQRVSDCFVKAGFKAPVLDNIRSEIWLKLWGNLTFNPISSLAHATLVDICQYPLTRELAAAMMTEAQAVANKLGISFRVGIDKRIAGAEKVGKHKTIMLQDIEAGRAPEIDALVGSVVELGRLTTRRRRTSTRSMRWSSCWAQTMAGASGQARRSSRSAPPAPARAARQTRLRRRERQRPQEADVGGFVPYIAHAEFRREPRGAGACASSIDPARARPYVVQRTRSRRAGGGGDRHRRGAGALRPGTGAAGRWWRVGIVARPAGAAAAAMISLRLALADLGVYAEVTGNGVLEVRRAA